MIREGLNILDAHSKSTIMIGDRMDTDIQVGAEAGLGTILVLGRGARRGGRSLPVPTVADRGLGGRPDRRTLGSVAAAYDVVSASAARKALAQS